MKIAEEHDRESVEMCGPATQADILPHQLGAIRLNEY